MHTGLVLEMREHARALDRDDRLLEPAEPGVALGQRLEAPAVQLGVALVHAIQIAREQRRLLAAGAGADLEDGAPVVGLVLGQQRDPERLLERRDALLERRQLVLGELPHLGVEATVSQHLLEPGGFALRRPQRLDAPCDLLDFGVFLGKLDISLARRAGHHLAELLVPGEDTVELGLEAGGASAVATKMEKRSHLFCSGVRVGRRAPRSSRSRPPA